MNLVHRLAGALAAASITLAALPAAAQIVNVQPLIANQQSVDGVTLIGEAAADVRGGNTRLISLSGNGLVEVRKGRHLFFLLARGDFAARAGEPFVSKDLEHFRYRILTTGPLELEAFIQHDRDAFRRLSLRVLGGAGPRLHLRPFGGFEAAIGAALMVEHERLGGGDEPDAGDTNEDVRLSTYLFLATDIAPRLKLGNTVYVQPRLDHFTDIRVLNELSLIARATDHISLKATFTSAYDSEPPLGVIPLDSTMKGAIQVNF